MGQTPTVILHCQYEGRHALIHAHACPDRARRYRGIGVSVTVHHEVSVILHESEKTNVYQIVLQAVSGWQVALHNAGYLSYIMYVEHASDSRSDLEDQRVGTRLFALGAARPERGCGGQVHPTIIKDDVSLQRMNQRSYNRKASGKPLKPH